MPLIDGRVHEKDDANKLKVQLVSELKNADGDQGKVKGSAAMKRPAAATTLAGRSTGEGRSSGG
eukprot:1556430-Pyramimonas_sp.AAC.1